MVIERIQHEPVSKYSPKTYIGNWYEEGQRYQKKKYNHITTYTQDYVSKPSSKQDIDETWDIAFKAVGSSRNLLFGHGGDRYFNNFTTTYDLSYNYFVQKAKERPVKRHWQFSNNIWLPEVDYTENYGNLTDYGITTYKKYVWDNEKSDPRITDKIKTEYQDSYIPVLDEGRREKRRVTPSENCSLLNKNNIDYQVLRYRDMKLFNVTPNEKLVVLPKEPKCNPITWECHDEKPCLREIM